MMNLHSALKTSIISKHAGNGIEYQLVRLQNSKDSFIDTLHARPNSFSSSGIQTTDFLSLIGFSRSSCAFHQANAFCREVPADINLNELSDAISNSFKEFERAASLLESCGLSVKQPEGFGYFFGTPAIPRTPLAPSCRGDGHTSPRTERMKESQDEFFYYTLTWIEGGNDKGWTTHYRAKHSPLSDEIHSVMDFIGGFHSFPNCPEYDFEECLWRFTPLMNYGDGFLDSNAGFAHRAFDSHASNFSEGIKALLNAHAFIEPWGISFLTPKKSAHIAKTTPLRPAPSSTIIAKSVNGEFKYDVAFSFAGTERSLVEEIATIVRNKGFNVFYDNFYPEQLWGKNLVEFFDGIYRKESRYCVMFLSNEYSGRMWTTHERRSATARAIQERGKDYILPVKIEDVDIDGLTPTVGYISATDHSSQQIAELLIKKLTG